MIDIATAIKDYLTEPSPLYTLTADRIWEEAVYPPPGYTPAVGGAIVFATRGGAILYSNLLNPRVQFKCYGATPAAANAVYRALVDRLHEAKTGTIRQALLDQFGQLLTEPDTNWHFTLAFFRFWF